MSTPTYTFEILLYSQTNGEETLVERKSFINIPIINQYVHEFTVTRFEEIGKPVRFVVIDNTSYGPRMKQLALLARPNAATSPISIQFPNSTSPNANLRRFQFDIMRFKSCLFEFDTHRMNSAQYAW